MLLAIAATPDGLVTFDKISPDETPAEPNAKYWWTSWITGNYEDEGCTTPPFQYWVTGSISRPDEGLSPENLKKYHDLFEEDEEKAYTFLDEHGRGNVTICANISAPTEAEVWELVAKHFPDYVQRFINPCGKDDPTSNRFIK